VFVMGIDQDGAERRAIRSAQEDICKIILKLVNNYGIKVAGIKVKMRPLFDYSVEIIEG
jgi:hypothetical protein